MPTTGQLESQAQNDRAQIAETLETLRSRMSPGQLVDQAIDYARNHGASDYARNFGDQVKANPLPLALVVAGLGWLMIGRPPTAVRREDAPSIVPDEPTLAGTGAGLQGALSSARGAVGSASDRAAGIAATTRASVSSGYEAAADAVGRVGSAVSDTAAAVGQRADDLRDSAARMGHATADRARAAGHRVAHNAGQVRHAMTQAFHEQPLVIGAVGLAIGAILAAILPRSRAENELMGATSDSVKSASAELVHEQTKHLEDAGRIVERVGAEAEHQGFTPDSAETLTQEIGAKVSAVAAAAREGTGAELKAAKDQARPEPEETGQDKFGELQASEITELKR